MKKKEPTMTESPLYGPTRGSVGCDDCRFIGTKESRLRAFSGEAPFEIRPYNFGELAQMYYPDHPYDSALRLFREEMHQTRGLWDAMVAQGYKEKKKVLTRAQVKVIVKYLDPPI